MALVAVAACAAGLDAHHAVARIADGADVRLVDRRVETWPAGAALELRLGAEQRQAAEPAAIDAIRLVVEQAAAEGRLGAVMQEDVALLGRQVRFEAPLLFGRRW